MPPAAPRVHEVEHHTAERATTRPVVSGTQGVVVAALRDLQARAAARQPELAASS